MGIGMHYVSACAGALIAYLSLAVPTEQSRAPRNAAQQRSTQPNDHDINTAELGQRTRAALTDEQNFLLLHDATTAASCIFSARNVLLRLIRRHRQTPIMAGFIQIDQTKNVKSRDYRGSSSFATFLIVGREYSSLLFFLLLLLLLLTKKKKKFTAVYVDGETNNIH